MFEVIVAFFALIVAFAALWYAGEANKRAETQQQQFYDAHIKTLKSSITDIVRAMRDNTRRIYEVEQLVEKLIKTSEDQNIGPTLADLRGEVTQLQEELDQLVQRLADARPSRRRSG